MKLHTKLISQESQAPATPKPGPVPVLPDSRGLVVARAASSPGGWSIFAVVTKDGVTTYERLTDPEPKSWAMERWALESLHRVWVND